MKLAVFGGGGTIGTRIVDEAVRRGHQVTQIVRDLNRTPRTEVTFVQGDALDRDTVARSVAGHDAIITAIGPTRGATPEMVVQVAKALIDGSSRAGVRRLLVVGGAGSLDVAPGVQLLDAPQFPTAWRPIAIAHREALDVYRATDASIDWTYVSPPALIEPGTRTGAYRLGGDELLTDPQGNSRISVEDYAVAILDEVERPRFSRQRITVAY